MRMNNGYATYNQKLSEAKSDGKSLKEALDYATGQAAEEGDQTLEDMGNNVFDENGEDTADLGGILLSPVFYLINFVADAITSNLGRIMIGNDPSFSNVTGTKVLQKDPITNIDGKSSYAEVDADLDNFLGVVQYPNIPYTPEEIFAGKIDLLSIDFISGKNANGEEITGDWASIRTTISQWYSVLRMVAIIGLLSVLIYTGIKIIISANAKDKAKYKEWIINWFMAVAILFAMHFIMAFIISVTGEFSKLINNACQGIRITGDGNGTVTNLMGLVRFMIQSEDFYKKVAYEVMYIALLVYTIKFTLVYLKRVLNMAFLTLIAPIVALTYPIDKINDGRAQGFDMWLKEYIFNAILQPMHQLMYYILVGSAVSIAASNPIYGIVVLMFMTEAEKLLKRIFGFDKAGGGTVGGMAGAFAAGAIASNIKDIARMAKLPGGNGNKSGSGNTTIEGVKPTEKPGMNIFENDVGADTRAEISSDTNISSNNNQGTAQKRMLDSYDSADKESIDTYYPEGMNLEEGQRDFLREEGYSEKDISDSFAQSANNTELEQIDNENETEFSFPIENPEEESNEQPNDKKESRQASIREMAANAKRGAKAVGKRLIKPAYDTDKSWQYNLKRAAKGAVRAGVGFSVGTAAAAVQAGISITDGKYNPAEGVASFAAGYAGGGQITKGVGSLYETYQEGTLPDDPQQRKKAIMDRAQKTFGDRDDVIAFNKKNYPGQEKEIMQRQKDHYLTAGITDLKEMKSGIKYADALVGKTEGLTKEQIQAKRKDADRKAAATIDFRNTLKDQGQLSAVYDKDKQDKYIQSMVDKASQADKAKVRRQYENAFKSVVAYDAANG